MSASNTDKLRKGYYGAATALAGSIGNTDTTIPFNSTAGWPTDTAIDVTVDRVDASGNKTPSKQETITVVISGNNGITALRGVEGSAQAHSSGAVVEITYTAATHNDEINAILQDHDQQGRAKQLTDTNGKLILALSPTSNAVNYAQDANAATGNGPSRTAAGTDANIDYNVSAKGTGKVYADGAAPQPLAAALASAWVESGCVITATTGLGWSMTAGVVWVNGKRYNVASATGNVTASKDTYFDVLVGANQNTASQSLVNTGANIVANGAASPTLAANSIRIGKVISGGSTISSITQSGTDSLNNFISPINPLAGMTLDTLSSKLLLDFGNHSLVQALIDGLSLASGKNYIQIGKTIIQWASTTVNVAATNTSYGWSVTWPITFPTAVLAVCQTVGMGNSLGLLGTGAYEGLSTTGASGFIKNTAGTGTATINTIAIGY